MENKINIAEILKDCPKGMELDCKICNGVKFIEVVRNPYFPIVVRANNGYEFILTKYGQVHNIDDAKCVIFPKDKTTWEGFVPPCKFKDGDILVHTQNQRFVTSIYHNRVSESIIGTHCILWDKNEGLTVNAQICYYPDNTRLATEEEKAKLFQAIKENGYKWNAETKTLEKLIEPKFKIGDRIVKRNSISNLWIVSSINSQYYGLNLLKGGESIGVLSISEQDGWELAPNIEPKFKVGDRVKDKNNFVYTILSVEHCGYMLNDLHRTCIGLDKQDNYELFLDKFDITTLKPFDKVLVRVCDTAKWFGDFYLWYDDTEKDFPYNCVGGTWSDCIPYESNEHLLGTTDNCDEYYKIWE